MSRKESKTSKVFDKMVGFGSSNKSRGKYPPGQLQRPSSVGDFNDVDDENWNINQMPDYEVNAEFNKMLENMNLSDVKKKPLESLPMSEKRKMLSMNNKNMARTQYHNPADYIQYLSNPDLSLTKKFSCIESLRVALTNNSLEWIQEFGTKGLKQVLGLLNECFRWNDSKWDKVQHECIKCLKAIMNNKVGLKDMFEHKEALTLVARSLNPNLPLVMQDAVKLMAAVCLVPPDGHEKTLEAITIAGEMSQMSTTNLQGSSERFGPIVQGLLISNNEQLRTNCLTLINAIISSPEDLDFRMHLRNEFMRVGLVDVLDPLEQNPLEELQTQLKVFYEHRDEDFDEFAQRFDNIRLELDDVSECFELIKNTVLDSPAEPFFLSILQHLICIRDDLHVRPAYYKLIEECVSQIVLHKSGHDPDFRATKRFQVDVEPLIEHLVERAQVESESATKEVKRELDDALTQKQEVEAKLANAEGRISQLEQQLRSGGASPTKLPVPEGLLKNPGGMPLPPAPPPPPPPPGGGLPPPPPPPPGGPGGPPPPPPPPPPGMGGPPPPPPPPGMGGPPPPPPPGPPGLRPPGPPGAPIAPPSQDDILIKLGMKRKQQWKLDAPTKRTNWKVVPTQKLTKEAFWTQVDEERLFSKSLMEKIQTKFGSKPAPKPSQDEQQGSKIDGGHSKKKTKELKVLDPKAGQNLSILLGGPVKHISYEELKLCILRCDTSVLTESLLESLIQYVPAPDQLNKLKEFESEYDNLAEAEQFAISISGIKRLVPRLKSLLFQQRYSELKQDIKPHIVAAKAACEEVRRSKKFAKILELILLIGNIMNTGSKNAQSVGFDISYLPKLANTKDRDNKNTLMHFLVEHIEKDYPELLSFPDEMIHIESASRVNIENIQKLLKQMENSIKALDMDLKNAARAAPEKDDKFAEAMGPFCGDAQAEYDVLNGMFKNLDKLYSELEKFYVFDKQKYHLEEFMSDIKTFIKLFKDAYTSMIKEREANEKLIRAREAREKQDKERAERAERKKALVDFNAPENQEGVMDSLLEALKTGSAFNRDQKRKRPPRAAGAERRAQLNRSRSRGPNGHGSPGQSNKFDIVDIITDSATTHNSNHHNAENDPMLAMLSDNGGPRRQRQGRTRGANASSAVSREREYLPSNSSNTQRSNEDGDALLRKLRAL